MTNESNHSWPISLLKTSGSILAATVLGLAFIAYQNPSLSILLEKLPFCG